jgi:hypothetical protein
MSKIPGEFNETVLQDIRVRLEQLRLDDRVSKQFMPTSMETMNAISAATTAQVNPLFGNNAKDDEVELIWMNTCGLECEPLSNCKPEAGKLSTNAKKLILTQEQEVNFQIDENDLRDNVFTFEEAFARGIMSAEARHIECIQQYCIAVLNANKGVNLKTGGKGVVVGSDTIIDPALWDASLYAYFQTVMARNRFTNAVMLTDNESLFEGYVMSMFNSDNTNGKGDLAAFNSLPTFYDLFNLTAVNDPDIISYLISVGSVAFASKGVYETTPTRKGDVTRWTYDSPLLPGLKINMMIWDDCSHNFNVQTVKTWSKYDLFVNPEGCEDDNTGILTFVCDSIS